MLVMLKIIFVYTYICNKLIFYHLEESNQITKVFIALRKFTVRHDVFAVTFVINIVFLISQL